MLREMHKYFSIGVCRVLSKYNLTTSMRDLRIARIGVAPTMNSTVNDKTLDTPNAELP